MESTTKSTVSIAIATYNGEKYLRQLLDSIYSQTYPFYEVVVSDDLSTDSTVSILNEYREQYGLRYTVNGMNLGFVGNFENAIKMCIGDYIALCDQDDIWEKEKIQSLLQNIGSSSMIFSDASIIDSNGELISASMMHSTKRFHSSNDQFNRFLFENYIPGCTMLFKRSILSKALPFPEGLIFHDWWLAICASLDSGIVFFPAPLIKYRHHSNNQTNTGTIDKGSIILKKLTEFRSKRKSGFYEKRLHSFITLRDRYKDSGMDFRILDERIEFYLDIKKGLIHPRAAYIAWKHRRRMLAKRSPIGKIIFIVATFFA